MLTLSLALAGALALGAETHSNSNPVFEQLVEKGVSPGGENLVPLPVPTMADGLDAAAQRKVIETLGGARFPYSQLTRRSTVAPHILRMRNIDGPDPQTPLQAVDLFFVAYGEMDALTNKNFLSDAFKENRGQDEAEGVSLTPEELAERSIEIATAAKDYEGYGQATFELLNRVELSVVGRSFWSRTEDSIVTAAIVDPRFSDDAKYPNVWRTLKRNAAGALVKGAPLPYRGAGLYMKMTKLHEPQGAVFVEAHIVFAEPHGWFDGKNLLGAKLPAVANQKVREMRQEMLRAQAARK
ncbi:MAG: hypothetical protein KY476_06050 [Planctomycetes bacterium]|nr:hypothetical protein [Planctomycetota bacterium]